MLASVFSLMNALLGGLIDPLVNAWVAYKKDKLTVEEAGFEAAAKSDATVMQAALASQARNNALKIQVYGHFINRAVMWVAGFPAALHFGLVFIDTMLAAKVLCGAAVLGVPKLPAPYDGYEWAIVTSFFLVQGVHLGTSNVAAWLSKS